MTYTLYFNEREIEAEDLTTMRNRVAQFIVQDSVLVQMDEVLEAFTVECEGGLNDDPRYALQRFDAESFYDDAIEYLSESDWGSMAIDLDIKFTESIEGVALGWFEVRLREYLSQRFAHAFVNDPARANELVEEVVSNLCEHPYEPDEFEYFVDEWHGEERFENASNTIDELTNLAGAQDEEKDFISEVLELYKKTFNVAMKAHDVRTPFIEGLRDDDWLVGVFENMAGIDRYSYMNEVYQVWAVDAWLYHKLKEHGEGVMKWNGLRLWGRTTLGQAIYMDGVIQRIAGEVVNSAFPE